MEKTIGCSSGLTFSLAALVSAAVETPADTVMNSIDAATSAESILPDNVINSTVTAPASTDLLGNEN